jgi:hypothetical protein
MFRFSKLIEAGCMCPKMIRTLKVGVTPLVSL